MILLEAPTSFSYVVQWSAIYCCVLCVSNLFRAPFCVTIVDHESRSDRGQREHGKRHETHLHISTKVLNGTMNIVMILLEAELQIFPYVVQWSAIYCCVLCSCNLFWAPFCVTILDHESRYGRGQRDHGMRHETHLHISTKHTIKMYTPHETHLHISIKTQRKMYTPHETLTYTFFR